jgi:predicted KAP-like P-loop ATPase
MLWKDSETDVDFLNFTEVAEQIATLISSPGLLPVSIGVFGTWGTGKSTVLRLAEAKLLEQTPTPMVIKFDAWLYQGFDDAKAALMDVVSARLLAEAQDNRSLLDKVKIFAGRVNYFRALGMAADFGIGMALGIPPGLLTTAGSVISNLGIGKIDAAQIQELKDGAQGAAGAWGELIKPQEAKTPAKEIAAFRKEFEAILDELGRPLVLFIDNLDRCLPDVAIGTLEAIRLFLFIEGTAFVIAADEDMVRHSVAKHFKDPNARHVHDYLDKVIQVPFQVPRIGVSDLRAYMYSLFVSAHAANKLRDVQQFLLKKLQDSWKGEVFTGDDVLAIAGDTPALRDALAVADRLAPILATAPRVEGNPRIVKRLLNAVGLRQALASTRKMNVDLATLSKLAVFERSTDATASQKLYTMVMDIDGAETAKLLVPLTHENASMQLPAEWKLHEDFIKEWRSMEPHFTDVEVLRPAVFLSRDVMAPAAVETGLSPAAGETLKALDMVTSVNSPAAKQAAAALPASEARKVMGAIIAKLRLADWTKQVPGTHGAVILANQDAVAKADFAAFLSTLEPDTMHKTTKYLFQNQGLM